MGWSSLLEQETSERSLLIPTGLFICGDQWRDGGAYSLRDDDPRDKPPDGCELSNGGQLWLNLMQNSEALSAKLRTTAVLLVFRRSW